MVRTHIIDGTDAAQRLADAISFPTVSGDSAHPAFEAFRSWLEDSYPLVHSVMETQTLGGGTLLFRWGGTGSSKRPVLLAGHYDVVPADSATIEQWTHAPFSGALADGYVWGRGALDNKAALISMMEAAEALLESGFRPVQTVYFSFGHDEEVGGSNGAAVVVDHLRAEGVRIAWTLDEGSYLIDGVFPGMSGPLASINVAEKGYMTLLITASGAGGHSSVPPHETAVGSLAHAIVAIQDNPMPGELGGLAAKTFEEIAPHLGYRERLLFANRWLFKPVLEYLLSRQASTDALLRTTAAPTMLSGSIKENVLPSQASATINFRIHPRDSAEDVLAHVQGILPAEEIEVTVLNGRITPPSKVSSHRSTGYQLIASSLRQTFGNIVIVPGLTMAGTDSKHYSKIADDSYRINPFVLSREDAARVHGIDERVSVRNLAMGVAMYRQLLQAL